MDRSVLSKHEMEALAGRDRPQRASQMLAAPGERRMALLHESELARTDPDPPFLHRPMRYDIGLPSTVI